MCAARFEYESEDSSDVVETGLVFRSQVHSRTWHAVVDKFLGVQERLKLYSIDNLLMCSRMPINQPLFRYNLLCAEIKKTEPYGLPAERYTAILLGDLTGNDKALAMYFE